MKSLISKLRLIELQLNLSNESKEVINEAIKFIENIQKTELIEYEKVLILFTNEMKGKFISKLKEGRKGWNDPEQLIYIEERMKDNNDPIDIANYAMFLWNLSK